MSRFNGVLAAALVASAALAPVQALALTKPEAAAAWVARSQAFIAVLEDPTTNERNVLKRQHEACKGLTGERMKMGGYWPIWAAEGMGSFCRSLDGFHGAITVKDPCTDLKKAGGYFAKAKPFGDSEAVVPTAAKMVAMIEVMRASAREAGFRRC